MGISAGADHTEYFALQDRQDDPNKARVIGCYSGKWESKNVHDPMPGYQYRHVRRDYPSISARRRDGWEVVRAEDQEFQSGEGHEDYAALGIDSSYASGELVLMRIPDERFREVVEDRLSIARHRLDGAISGSDYLGKDHLTGTPRASGKQIFVKHSNHGNVDVGPEGL